MMNGKEKLNSGSCSSLNPADGNPGGPICMHGMKLGKVSSDRAEGVKMPNFGGFMVYLVIFITALAIILG